MALFEPIEPNVIKLKAARNVKALVKALKYMRNPDVRKNAAAALGDMGDERAVQPLIEALKDENKYVRKSAAEACGKLGDERLVEPLIEALSDADWFVQEKVAAALGKVGDTRAIGPLALFIESLEHEHFRETARAALNSIKLRQRLRYS